MAAPISSSPPSESVEDSFLSSDKTSIETLIFSVSVSWFCSGGRWERMKKWQIWWIVSGSHIDGLRKKKKLSRVRVRVRARWILVVSSFLWGFRDEQDADRTEIDYDSDSLSSPLSNLNLSSSFKQKLNLSEALDEDRLISFFRRLKNLTQLLVVGRKLAVPLKPRFYIPGVASKLDFVAVHLRNGESTYEDEDDNLLFSAYALPALTKLTLLGFTTFTHHWPSVTPNGEPSRPLEGLPAKRSWGLTHLVLDWYGEIPPLAFPFGLLGVRNNSPNSFNSIPLLFRSFNSLQCLTLNLQQCPPNLGHFLSFLPSTLLSLSVRIGRPIHHTHPIAPVMPKLDNIPQLFPSIRHLKLGSEIFTSKLITSLSTATSLGCIHFDVDAPLFPIHLGDLIAGPNRSPTLVSIEISICHDDHDNLRPPGARKSPQWDTGMTKTQAKAFVKLAEVSGVKVIGSVLCALKICGGQGCGGHVCARCP